MMTDNEDLELEFADDVVDDVEASGTSHGEDDTFDAMAGQSGGENPDDSNSAATSDEGEDVAHANDEDRADSAGIHADADAPESTGEFEAVGETEFAGTIEASGETEVPGELEGTELENFEAADIEDVEVLAPEQIRAVVEASLFATDKPLSLALIKQVFKGTQVKSKDVRAALTELQEEYNSSARGFSLEEIAGGFQLRTKPEVMKYLRQSAKARPFKLSGPALEVLSIVAYKQPTTKAQIDEIRGVESGHLLRALMEKSLLTFGERSELPGKPMFYETTKKFLEIFSLRNLGELPSLSEIDQLIPEGIGEVEDKETLSDLTGELSKEAGASYSEGEDELLKITDELTQISTSSDFFEQEKQRERERRDKERARDLREALTVGESIEDKDRRWLERYEQAQAEASASRDEVAFVTDDGADEPAAVPREEPAPDETSAALANEGSAARPSERESDAEM